MCDWFFPTKTQVVQITPVSEIVIRHIDSIMICKLCDSDVKTNIATCSSCEYHLGHPLCVTKTDFPNCPLCFSVFESKLLLK